MKNRQFKPRSKTWLAWLGLGIFAAGGLLIWLLTRQPPGTDITAAIRYTAFISILAGGLCIILASADWWLKR